MELKIPAGEIRKILDRDYGIKMGQVQRRYNGLSNCSLVVSSPQRQLTVRVSRDASDIKAIKFEDQVTEFLARHHIPIRSVVKTSSGQPYSLTPYNQTVTVFRYVNGQYLKKVTPLELKAAGKALRELHKTLADFPSLVNKKLLLADRLASTLKNTDNVKLVKSLDKDLLLEADKVTQLIHGDFNPGNFIYSGGEVSGIFDFEHAGLGSVYFDMGTLGAHYLFLLPEFSAGEVTRTIFDGYGLNNDQRKVALEAIKLTALWLLANITSTVTPQTNQEYLQGNVKYHRARIKELMTVN